MPQTIGIDIGSQKTILVADDGDIVRTSTGNVPRRIGDEATSGDTIIAMINVLAGKQPSEIEACAALSHSKLDIADGNCKIPNVVVKQGEQMDHVTTSALLGFYIHKLWERTTQVYGDSVNLSFAVYPSATNATIRSYFDGSVVAGLPLDKINVVDAADALVAAYSRKLSALKGNDRTALDNKLVALVEVGHIQTSCVIVQIDPLGCVSETSIAPFVSKIAVEHDGNLGSFHFDLKLFDHFAKVCETKHATKVTLGSKRGNRLLAGCERLRKLLSQLNEASVTVENLTDNGDVSFSLKRDEFHSICGDLTARIAAMLQSAATKATAPAEPEDTPRPAAVEYCEILGGGLRMPAIQNLLGEIFGKEVIIGAKLDDSSVAIGAALLTNRHSTNPENIYIKRFEHVSSEHGLSAEELTAARSKELDMQAMDDRVRQTLAIKNSLEAYILEMRSAPKRKFGELIDSGKLNNLLDDNEGWLWDNPDATYDELSGKDRALRDEVKDLCKNYLEAVEAERLQREATLEAEAAQAAAEKGANGEEDDHDNRKLKKADRMRLVVKNKDEGTELFKGGNYRPAAARYHKALSHAAKFFDLSPDDESEVKAIQVNLYLNLASCYIKLGVWDQVLRNCTEAETVEPKNPKIFFRRSQYHENKKDYDKALADMKKCQVYMDVEDKSVTKNIERLQKIIQQEKAKEKKMWGKAFGA